MSSKEKTKKVASTDDGEPARFIRIVRVRVHDSHFAAFQIEVITTVGDAITSRESYGGPDLLEVILARVKDALDPEGVVSSRPTCVVA